MKRTTTALCLLLIGVFGTIEAKNHDNFSKGIKLWKQGNYGKAITLFDSALKKEPNNPVIWAWRGSACFSLRNYMQAIQDFSVAINLDPYNGFYYFERALAYFALGNTVSQVNDLICAARLGNIEAQRFLSNNRIRW